MNRNILFSIALGAMMLTVQAAQNVDSSRFADEQTREHQLQAQQNMPTFNVYKSLAGVQPLKIINDAHENHVVLALMGCRPLIILNDQNQKK